MALTTTQKGTSTVAGYMSKMKSLADDMASAGKKLDDEELCSYILAGLDFEYNSLVSSIAARVEPITLGELYSQMLALETEASSSKWDKLGTRRLDPIKCELSITRTWWVHTWPRRSRLLRKLQQWWSR
jgi:hypothetical protein